SFSPAQEFWSAPMSARIVNFLVSLGYVRRSEGTLLPMREAPLTRRDFQVLADLRAKEARVLANNGNEQGAYYLGGYAVECALKACISKQTRRHEFPPKIEYVREAYSHKLTSLLRLAELEEQL